VPTSPLPLGADQFVVYRVNAEGVREYLFAANVFRTAVSARQAFEKRPIYLNLLSRPVAYRTRGKVEEASRRLGLSGVATLKE
jgi:hypothetical protein